MFCMKCGQPLSDDANFCGSCGTRVNTTMQAYPSTSPTFSSANSAPITAPGQKMLKVVSILFIIGAALTFIFIILSFVGMASLLRFGGGFAAGLMALSLVGCIALLVAGIIGLKKCGNPQAAMFFIVSGFILCGYNLINTIISFQVVGLVGLTLPILFIVGGFMNKKTLEK